MIMQNVAVVIPTCRDLSFLEKWRNTDLIEAKIYVVEDKPEITIKPPKGFNCEIYSHKEINDDLGKDSWIIARGDGGIKSYGLLKAWRDGADIIICLDDDVFPLHIDFVQQHLNQLNKKVINSNFVNSVKSDEVFMRGVPYSERKRKRVVFNMGLWTDNPDFDALTQISYRGEFYRLRKNKVVPKHSYFPHCVMNVAMRNEVVPIMYQLLMGPKWNMFRFDDIWSGIFMKKICDHLDVAVTLGEPWAKHSKASNPWTNLKKESQGLEMNEKLWKYVEDIKLTETTYAECYWELADKLSRANVDWCGRKEYFENLFTAMKLWSTYFIFGEESVKRRRDLYVENKHNNTNKK